MRQSLLDTIMQFAKDTDAVSALILIGSRARSEAPADAYSDTDLLLIADDIRPFVSADGWLTAIGNFHIAFSEPTVDGQVERRVLFDGAQDVDFVLLPTAAALRALETGEAAQLLRSGYRVLVDKEDRFRLPPIAPQGEPFVPATEAEFGNTVNDFWFHTVWTAKKLLRGELWTAKFCVDTYLKWKLLWIIEQHAHIVRHTENRTWYRGRFIERWAPADVVNDLQRAFAHYDPADMARALWETMRLFRRLAEAVAQAAGYTYPAHADAYATQFVAQSLAPLLPPVREGDAL